MVTGIATLVSRITGLLREILYAVMFGASAFMDAWLVTFKIPNFLRRLFAEGSFSQAFVPVISEYKHKRSHDEVRQLVDEVAGTFGVLLFVVTAIGVIAAPIIIFAFAPAWHDQPDQWHAASAMLRWTFPYLFFISLSALFSGVLNSYNKFALPAYTQVIMNIVMIIVTVWIAPKAANPGMALAMGVFVSGMLQLGFQLPAVIKRQFGLDEETTDELVAEATEAEHEAIDLYHFTSLINRSLEEDGRRRVVEMMWEMVYADGRVSEFERNLIWRAADLLGVSSRERIELGQRVASRQEID